MNNLLSKSQIGQFFKYLVCTKYFLPNLYKTRLLAEATFREKMYKFDDVLQGKVSKDKTNKPLSKELKKKYRSNVTKFMRDSLGLKKKVK